jgi:F0F1-type ATP synthase epsilon subunit
MLLDVSSAKWVHVQLVDGTGLTIYPGHAPLLAETTSAPLRYADAAGEHSFGAEPGIVQVQNDVVTMFTSSGWEAEEAPDACTVSEERRFERLARQLRRRLEDESETVLGVDREQT